MKVTTPKPQVLLFEQDSQLTIDTISGASSSSYSSQPLLIYEDEFPLSYYFKTDELLCLNQVKRFCLEKHLNVPNQLIYRFAFFHGFNVKRVCNAIIKNNKHHHHEHHYYCLNNNNNVLMLKENHELANYLETTKIMFPLPGLKSAIGSDVLYVRPSRYLLPSASSNRLFIESLCYVLNDMSQTIDQCRNGILMIVNMDGYKIKNNFHRDTKIKLTKIITEGHLVPASVVQILIVNHQPKVFERVWRKTIIHPAYFVSPLFFSKRIHFIECSQLSNYLMMKDGYEEYLPDELYAIGEDTAELVEDYIAMKKHEESLL